MSKRILSMLMAIVLIVSCTTVVPAEEAAESPHKIEMKNYPLYLFAPDNELPDGIPLYFADGAQDLPFVDLKDWTNIIAPLGKSPEEPYVTMTVNEAKDQVSLLRDNGSSMICNFTDGTILFDDYLSFQQDSNKLYIDLAALKVDKMMEGSSYLLATDNRVRLGSDTVIDLKKYGIPMIMQDEKYLVPLQTIATLCFSEASIGVYFNQESVIFAAIAQIKDPDSALLEALASSGLLTPEIKAEAEEKTETFSEEMAYITEAVSKTEEGKAVIEEVRESMKNSLSELYMSGPKGPRSDALAKYGYAELCMELDFLYGLKGSHHIDSFDHFFSETGLTEKLLNPDASIADSAIGELTEYWLDDLHSGFSSRSYLSEGNKTNAWQPGFSTSADAAKGAELGHVRAEYPNSTQPYYEVGNTAYVTFDKFLLGTPEIPDPDYYALAEQDALPDDTISQIIRAHKEITRENSPIKNVVLDLSANSGGAAPAAVYVLCWFLGVAPTSVTYMATGTESTMSYQADVNLDHEFDEKDTISNLNLFCLTSSQSFSCANLVPWAFKEDGRVTLLGKTSGGGSCVVRPLTTAWGTSYQISGASQISFVKNGAYYDVDQGVDPDYTIRDYNHFYDREALTEYINGLF